MCNFADRLFGDTLRVPCMRVLIAFVEKARQRG